MFKSRFTIRKRRKERHPPVIVGANRTSFKSMGITHSAKHGKRNNIKLKSNPNPSDKREAYLRKEIIKDFKFKFTKAFRNYKLSKEDIEELINYLEKKKK